MEEMINQITGAPHWLWLMSIIGGVVFAGAFNIPARRRFLSRESDSRTKAIRYDALNFIVFYFTFIVPANLMSWFLTGDSGILALTTAAFVLYSISFWIVLRSYIYWKDRHHGSD